MNSSASRERNLELRCLAPAPLVFETKGALLVEKKWTRGNLFVGFLDRGRTLRPMRDRVLEIAGKWSQHCGLQFDYLNDTSMADVRIALTNQSSFWSCIGTDAGGVDRSKPTMSLGVLFPELPDAELTGFVLHEFGHVLGLVHEHQSPSVQIQWNEDAVKQDLRGPPNYWDDATIKRNVFDRYERERIAATPYDPDSIMIYPIPEAWTVPNPQTGEHFSVTVKRNLSASDIDLIGRVYQ